MATNVFSEWSEVGQSQIAKLVADYDLHLHHTTQRLIQNQFPRTLQTACILIISWNTQQGLYTWLFLTDIWLLQAMRFNFGYKISHSVGDLHVPSQATRCVRGQHHNSLAL